MSIDPVQAFVLKSTIVAWSLLAITVLIAVVAGLLVFQAEADIEDFREQLQQVEEELPEALEAVDIAQRAADAASRTLNEVSGFQSFGQDGTFARALEREVEAKTDLTRAESAYTAKLTRAESLRIAVIADESSLTVQTVGGISAVVTSALLTVAFFAVSWFARALTAFPRRIDLTRDDESKDDA